MKKTKSSKFQFGLVGALALFIASYLQIWPTSPEAALALNFDSELPAPTNVCPVSKNGGVELTWDHPTNARVTGAVSRFRQTGSQTWVDGPVAVATNRLTVPGTNGVTYEYQVANLQRKY